MRKRIVIAGAVAVAIIAVAATAFAVDSNPLTHPGSKGTTGAGELTGTAPTTYPAAAPSASATKSVAATVAIGGKKPNPRGQYDLSWTLPTAGKSGCLVCHGDPDLVKVKNGKVVSLSVDYDELQNSAHKNVQCTGCHIDFAYKVPHENAKGEEWRAIAKSSCKNCHQTQYAAYTAGAHSPARPPGVKLTGSSAKGKPIPLCGDCHDSHSIPSSGTPEAAALHSTGMTRCGQCHETEAESYNDYYHGAAYQNGAPDAPACWDCHDTHTVLPSPDRKSPTNEDNLVATCSGDLAAGMTCHVNEPNEGFVAYSELIHSKQEVKDENPVYARIRQAQETVGSAWDSFTSRFDR